jgi:hypothetical protein
MTELHPRVADIIEALEASHRELVAVVMSIPADRRDAPSPDGRWSVAENIEHLAMVENGIGRLLSTLIKQIAESGARETETSSLLHSLDHLEVWKVQQRITAPERVQPVNALSTSDALEQLTAARTKFIAALAGGSGLALSTASAPHPFFGPLTVYEWGVLTAQHERRHTAQIRHVAGLE